MCRGASIPADSSAPNMNTGQFGTYRTKVIHGKTSCLDLYPRLGRMTAVRKLMLIPRGQGSWAGMTLAVP